MEAGESLENNPMFNQLTATAKQVFYNLIITNRLDQTSLQTYCIGLGRKPAWEGIFQAILYSYFRPVWDVFLVSDKNALGMGHHGNLGSDWKVLWLFLAGIPAIPHISSYAFLVEPCHLVVSEG